MKRLMLILATVCAISLSAFFCACSDDKNTTQPVNGSQTSPGNENTDPNGGGQTSLKNFVGLTFPSKTVTYDGNEYSITVSGTLPEGASVNYTNNTATNAGEYNATATVTAEGYNSLTLNSKLTINKAVITGVSFTDKTYLSNGSVRTIEISGELPEGSNVTYTNNSASTAGVYNATATITNPNYETLRLNAVLTINSAISAAKDIINSILDKPDPWDFMPTGLSRENMAYSTLPVTDFASFVNVSQIGGKIIGKQLNVLYEGLNSASTLLGYADTVYAVGDTIADVYQKYIDRSPEDEKHFIGEAAGFKVSISISDDYLELLAGNSAFSLEMTYNKQTGLRTGRIQLSDGMALKYDSTDNHIKFSVKATIAGAGNLKQIEFIRTDNAVTGYLYEYTGTEAHNIKTSAVISSNSVKTIVMSNKRESDDLLIKGYEEVYNSSTGEYIGGEVQETVKAVDFDTLWFMMDSVSGFNSVKVSAQSNGLNADTVFVNGATSAFATKKVGGLNLRNQSRRYDIEMKDVFYVIKTVNGGNIKYETVKASIPMVFVQKDQTTTFGKDVKAENPTEFAVAPILPDYTAVTASYEILQATFNVITENVLYSDIIDYIGTKNDFFTND